MEHPLPARPSFLPPRPGTTVSTTASADAGPSRLPPNPTASSSSTHGRGSAPSTLGLPPSKPIITTAPNGGCVICSNPPKYTCPRCATKTCSLPCSKTHKTRDECSGVRDPAAFVSLKEYGQGAWSDDYKWLEEGRRKVGGWGQGIKVEEVPASTSSSNNTFNRNGRGDRDRQLLRNRRGKKMGKVDGLKRELEKRGCSVQFMPEGMAKRKMNQSSWNPKSQQLYLTVHLSIPSNLLESETSTESHKTINHQRVLFASSSPASTGLPTLSSLLPETLDPTSVVLLLPFHSTPSQPAPEHTTNQKLFYPPLDSSKTLNDAMRGTAWVEFPVIQIMQRSEWEDGLKKGDIVVVPLVEPMVSVRDSGWGKRKATAGPMADAAAAEKARTGDDATEDASVGDYTGGEAKRARTDDGVQSGGGQSLVGLGDYASDDDDEDDEGASEYGGDEQQVVGEDDDAEDGDEVDPPLEVLQAVGAALIADLGEAA
ncbi:hypothetical protein IAU59_004237 [Kwoniella sp. CBS 9459]